MGSLEGKVAFITGGSRGIGAATVRTLASEGASVVIGYRSDESAAAELAQDVAHLGSRAVTVRCDVTERESLDDLAEAAIKEFGSLDIAVCNAGVEHFGPLESITEDNFDLVFRTNVAGQLFAAQSAAKVMWPGGRIVLTSSVSARIAVLHHALYAASKAAVSALARNLAPELAAREITINAVAPGGTNTDMAAEHGNSYTHPALRDVPAEDVVRATTSAGRFADPTEIAAVVAFLASPAASYISGSTVAIDGGWL